MILVRRILGHSLVRLLVPSRRSLIRLLRTARALTRSRADEDELNASISFNFNPWCNDLLTIESYTLNHCFSNSPLRNGHPRSKSSASSPDTRVKSRGLSMLMDLHNKNRGGAGFNGLAGRGGSKRGGSPYAGCETMERCDNAIEGDV